jgi:OOP family OmpA-OmpF porin
LFDLNSDQPLKIPGKELKTLAGLLKENPGMKLRIVGHTCDIAERNINLRVGMERAKTVKDKLVELGVSPAQLVTETKASDEPLVPNTSEKNRAKNCRVELFVE